MKWTKETWKRAGRTFLQTAIGYIAVNLAIVDFTAGKEIIKSALIGLIISAVSAGLSAVMNLAKNEAEETTEAETTDTADTAESADTNITEDEADK